MPAPRKNWKHPRQNVSSGFLWEMALQVVSPFLFAYLYVINQFCPIEHSAAMEMFRICCVQ